MKFPAGESSDHNCGQKLIIINRGLHHSFMLNNWI